MNIFYFLRIVHTLLFITRLQNTKLFSNVYRSQITLLKKLKNKKGRELKKS